MEDHLHKRTKVLKEGNPGPGPVIYWMQRDQRIQYNWAFLAAYLTAINKKRNMIVVFNLIDDFLTASIRHYHFMIEGLKEVELELKNLNIPFRVVIGNPVKNILKLIKENDASYLFTDFNPLKITGCWKDLVSSNINIPFYEIDTHNIVPSRFVSQKIEFGAYTIRPKIIRLLPEFLTGFPVLNKFPADDLHYENIDWDKLYKSIKISRSPGKVFCLFPGRKEALKILECFSMDKLQNYDEYKNDPTENATSNLSAYLHFGQISSQEIAIYLEDISPGYKKNFLEELIVRKELSDNFCLYNPDYDKFSGFPSWAKKTLDDHRTDKREYIYSLSKFENAETHDSLWNAAQKEMIKKGVMHGYMRMYWAKKMLEWTKEPEEALEYAIHLNDKYELDGRDPNGYAGIAWSVGGVHDRAWSERPVFGKVRYMNYNGCKRKFDVQKYILSVENF